MASVDEARFQHWYGKVAKKWDLDANPDAPEHHYDYRAAFKAGASPDKTGHWPSQFKDSAHPNRFVTVDGKRIDSITGEPAATKVFEIEIGGKIYEAEANDPESAVKAIKGLHLENAGQESVDRAMTGARARTEPNAADQVANITPEMGYFDTVGELDRAKANREKANVDASASGALTGLAMTIPAMAPARLGGAIMGGQETYRRTGGNVPATLGGAVAGAVAPGAVNAATLASGAVELAGGGTVGALTAGVAGLAIRRYGLGGAATKLAHMFGGDAKAAKVAIETAAKAAPASEKLRVARLTAKEADAALAESGLPGRPFGAAVQAGIPGTRLSAEETAGMVVRARANEAAAAARRGGGPSRQMPPPAVQAPSVPKGINSDEVLETVNRLSSARMDRGEIIKALKNSSMPDATLPEIGKVVDQIRKGHVVMPSPRGGPARPSPLGPTADEDIMARLQDSLAAYRMR